MTTMQNLNSILVNVHAAADKLYRISCIEGKKLREMSQNTNDYALQEMKVDKIVALYEKLEETGDALFNAACLYETCIDELDFDCMMKELGLD